MVFLVLVLFDWGWFETNIVWLPSQAQAQYLQMQYNLRHYGHTSLLSDVWFDTQGKLS